MRKIAEDGISPDRAAVEDCEYREDVVAVSAVSAAEGECAITEERDEEEGDRPAEVVAIWAGESVR